MWKDIACGLHKCAMCSMGAHGFEAFAPHLYWSINLPLAAERHYYLVCDHSLMSQVNCYWCMQICRVIGGSANCDSLTDLGDCLCNHWYIIVMSNMIWSIFATRFLILYCLCQFHMQYIFICLSFVLHTMIT